MAFSASSSANLPPPSPLLLFRERIFHLSSFETRVKTTSKWDFLFDQHA
jgi:hypothetical protein